MGTISVKKKLNTRVKIDNLGRSTPLFKDESIAAGLKPLAVGWRTALATDTTTIITENRVRTISDACPNYASPRADPH